MKLLVFSSNLNTALFHDKSTKYAVCTFWRKIYIPGMAVIKIVEHIQEYLKGVMQSIVSTPAQQNFACSSNRKYVQVYSKIKGVKHDSFR